MFERRHIKHNGTTFNNVRGTAEEEENVISFEKKNDRSNVLIGHGRRGFDGS